MSEEDRDRYREEGTPEGPRLRSDVVPSLRSEHERDAEGLDQIAAWLREAHHFDLSAYRASTVRRQLGRRIAATGATNAQAYLARLRGSPDEAARLKHSVLVSVTAFFRDPEVFARLGAWLSGYVAQSLPGRPLRLWVPGCASGEEVYSLAILLIETLGPRLADFDVHVFGTDADARATRFARQAVYPVDSVQALDDARRARFFVAEHDHVRVHRSVRDLCVFATHHLLQQAPFHNMDLVSCRNVLIYVEHAERNHVLHKLHYALLPGGCLVLGQLESVVPTHPLFDAIDAGSRLYARRPGPTPRLFDVLTSGAGAAPYPPPEPPREAELPPIARAVHSSIERHYAPPSVAVSPGGEVLHLEGATERYLALPSGSGGFRITQLCHPVLRGEVNTLLHFLGTRPDEELASQPVRWERDGKPISVRVVGRPLRDDVTGQFLGHLLSFEEQSLKDPPSPDAPDPDAPAQAELVDLRLELGATREHLHSLVEQLERANGDMHSANEELQASSEEVQSSNEELQASNEELLSMNEELQQKAQDLARSNETLTAIQRSIQAAHVVVDDGLHVVSFNALAVRIFGLLSDDRGRLLTAVPCSLALPSLVELVQAVVQTGESSVHRIDDADRHYLLQVSPYENGALVRCGAVLSFTDVGELRRAEEVSNRLHEQYRATFEQAAVGIAHLSAEGRWLRVNPLWCHTLGHSEAELQTQTLLDLTHPDDRALTRHQLARCTPGDHDELELRLLRRDGRTVWARIASTTVRGSGGVKPYRIAVFSDVTEAHDAVQGLRDNERELRQITASLPLLPWSATADGQASFMGEQWAEYLGVTLADIAEGGLNPYVHPDDRERIREAWGAAVASEQPVEAPLRLRRADGQYRWFSLRARPLHDEAGKVVRWFGANTDIHESHNLREHLASSLDALKFTLSGASVAPWSAPRTSDGAIRVELTQESTHEYWKFLNVDGGPERSAAERMRDAVHPLDFAHLQQVTYDAFQRAVPYDAVFRTHPERGPERWLLVRGHPVIDADGQCRRFHGMTVDITRQKAAEQQHAELSRRLVRANQLAGVGHFRYALATDELEMDALLEQMLGMPPGRSTRDALLARFEPESARLFRRGARAAFEAAIDKYEGTVGFGPADDQRFARMHVEFERDAAGAPAYVFGAIRDITVEHEAQLRIRHQRDQAEHMVEVATRDLRLKESQLAAILDGVPCAIGYWDEEGRSRYANGAHGAWFGIAPRDMDGRPIGEVWGGSFATELAEHVARALAGEGRRYELEVEPGVPGGDSRFAHVYLVPDRSGGRVHGFFSLVFDISSLKRAERQADAARRAKGEFLANMSHEIRTPLTAVLGLAELGARSAPTRDMEDCFGNILRAGRHLLAVVSDILDFSRIEAGRLEITPSPVDVAELIAQAITTVGAAAREKGLTLRIHEQAELPYTVRTDAARVAQILINLMNNAVKFTERGSVTASIGYTAGQLRLDVADTGIGMSEATQALLFQPFEQGVARTVHRQGGTGLGLAICKRIVAQMGGALQLTSRLGEGTEVAVAIPCEALAPPDWQPLQHTVFAGFAADTPRALVADLAARGCRTTLLDAGQTLPDDARCLVLPDGAEAPADTAALVRWLCGGGRIVCLLQPGESIRSRSLPEAVLPFVVYAQWPGTPLLLLLALLRGHHPPSERSAPATGPLAGVRVLAAEDQEMNRVLLRAMLAAAGASVVCVENGARALERLAEDGADAYDVLLCDIEMPELDGFATTQAVRARYPALPVIGLTAHAFELARERGRSAGMADYLTKPYSLRDLTEVIARHAGARERA